MSPDEVKDTLKKLPMGEFFPCALGLNKKSGDLVVAIHKARRPKMLAAELEEELGSTPIEYGHVTPEASDKGVLIYTHEGGKKIPNVEQKLSKYLKSNNMMYKSSSTVDVAPKNPKEISRAEERGLEEMIIKTATRVAENARINVLFFGRQVTGACESFKLYSKSELSALDGDFTAGDLLAPLVSIATGGIAGALAGAVEDKVGKFFVKEATKLGNDALNKRTKSLGNDSKDLAKAVDSLVQGAHDALTAMETVVNNTVVKTSDEIIIQVNAGNTLNTELSTFIEPFIRETTSKMDGLLESKFGIPSPAKSKKTQVEIYGGLVEAFEEKLIIAKTPTQERIEWKISGVPPEVGRNAKTRSQKAMKDRKDSIDKEEAKTTGAR